MKSHFPFALALLLLTTITFTTAAEDAAPATSSLWGARGEKWSPASRLPDFSFAGYHCGERPIPDVAATLDLAKFDIKGDGVTDDQPAIQKALDAAVKQAVVLPAGRFVLRNTLTLRKSHVVLRGAGIGKTILVIPQSLSELNPKAVQDGKQPYSFSGGFVLLRGQEKGVKLASITQPVARGGNTLTLDQPLALAPGTLVRILANNDETLGKLILGGETPGSATPTENKHYMDLAARVVSVEGNTLKLDRGLRLDLKPEWQAEVWSCKPTLEEAGVEGMTFEFAGKPKKPHLREEGFNAVYVVGAFNSWVRDVETIDCDNVVNVGASRYCTFQRITARADKRTTKATGHHGLWVKASFDCLFTDFFIDTIFVHDLTVEGLSCGNVFMNGKGQSLNLDHHRNAPYENLFTNLEVGNGERLWDSSGSPDRGPQSGVREVFWNLRQTTGAMPKRLPKFAQAILVGVEGYKPGPRENGQLVELPAGVMPGNLYEAQLARRLSK